MGKIRVLPTDLANQIAAGEVVERPASVVKELVENALDAGATKIKVELDHGGLVRIRVTDDGDGMDGGDARLALDRHATSKIGSVDDLVRITTFGFRGEALPSIGSVSRLRLTTRAKGAAEGTELVVEGGGHAKARPAGCAEGTSVEVSDLFFNVPARRKFLKAQATEAAHVGEVVLMAALASPHVMFTLARDGKVAREYLRVGTRKERAHQAIVEDRLEACFAERGPMKLEAHLAPPERARAGSAGLHIFVNGRPVKDRQLARAIAQSYGSVLEPGRYPVGVAYIELPHEMVDVNVHPQKSEVRFSDGRVLFDAVTRELYARLAQAFSIPAIGPASRPWFNSQRSPSASSVPPSGDDDTLRSIPRAEAVDVPAERISFVPASDAVVAPSKPYSVEPSTMKSLAERMAQGQTLSVEEPVLFTQTGFYGRLKFLAQVRATFLVCEGPDGLYVLDQHAAAERVTFDRLRRAFGKRAVATQRLLIPEVVTLSPLEVATLEEAADEVATVGVELRAVGTNAVAVHAVPKILARIRPDRLVRDLVAELGRAAKRPFGDAADMVLATMACHGSLRAGDTVSQEEATALLVALDAVDFAGHCPHGRPVVTRIGFEDLERRVGR